MQLQLQLHPFKPTHVDLGSIIMPVALPSARPPPAVEGLALVTIWLHAHGLPNPRPQIKPAQYHDHRDQL